MKRKLFFELLTIIGILLSACSKDDKEPSSTTNTNEPQQTIHVTSVKLNSTSLSLHEGDSFTLYVTISPSNALNTNVIWKSSDESIAIVNEKGVVQAKSIGNAIITVISEDQNLSATCNISVIEHNVTDIKLNENTKEMHINETFQLLPTITPENATNKNVSWSSSNENVASVDNTGKVSAISFGQAVITVITNNQNKTASCTIIVKPTPVENITLPESKNVYIGENFKLTAEIFPNDATNQNVKWSSSDETIAIVDGYGNVTAKAIGSTTIKVTTEDKNKTAVCKIIVNSSISLNYNTKSILIGDSFVMTATNNITQSAYENINWRISDENVATIDENGNVTAKSTGTTTIIATNNSDNTDFSTCTLTVKSIEDYIIIKFGTYSSIRLAYDEFNEDAELMRLVTEVDGMKYTQLPFSIINQSKHVITVIRLYIYANNNLIAKNNDATTILPDHIMTNNLTKQHIFTETTTFNVICTYTYNGETYTAKADITR